MKRGLITWDKTEISPAVFERRLQKFRRHLSDRQLPAGVVYSDLWRSNHARFFSNFMPYFNRALLVIPVDQPLTLLCGLTPRTYPWIRSVTPIEDVRSGGPGGNFARPLFELASERNWSKVGILDAPQLPCDISRGIHQGALEIVNIESGAVYAPSEDEDELAMRQKALGLAKDVLVEEMPMSVGRIDYDLVGRLERRFRRAGAEDLIVLLTNGNTVPRPAAGTVLEENFSVSLALEYRGHWVRLSRPNATPEVLLDCKNLFEQEHSAVAENLGGSYPYECAVSKSTSLSAGHVEVEVGGKHLFYGEMRGI